MIFHENHLLADDSHVISCLIFSKIRKDVAKISSAAVVISALRDKIRNNLVFYVKPGPKVIKLFSCSTQLSMKFQLFIKTKILKNKNFSNSFHSQILSSSCL